MKVDLDDVAAFVAVAELGGFGVAAEQLNLSQPALSRRIQKLEETLGVALLERTTRRVDLTTVGRDFLPKARRLLDDLEESLLSVRAIAERRTGQVSVACVPTAAYYFLPEVIRAYNAEYPNIRFRIVDEGANRVLQSVVNGEVDLGINLLGGQEPDILFDPLLQDPFVLACRNDHPLADRTEVEWRDLADYRFITVGRLSGNRLILDLGLGRPRMAPALVLRGPAPLHLAGPGRSRPRHLGPAPPYHAQPPASGSGGTAAREPGAHPHDGRHPRRGTTLSPAARQFYDMLMERWSRNGVKAKSAQRCL